VPSWYVSFSPSKWLAHNDKTTGGDNMADIQWLHKYEEGINLAREEQKPLFLDFFKNG
jgi:hypothetical protein